jgi:hypothetical protein
MKRILLITILVLSINIIRAQTAHPAKGDEFVGPFASWVKVTLGGDSITDATKIIQSQLDRIGTDVSRACVVYFPRGTYRITSTLKNNAKMSVSLIGENPATTKIIWDGPKDGTLLEMNGTAYSSVSRITFDGKSKAKVAIEESWDGTAPGYFDTGNEYTDNNFIDVGFGIHGGHKGYGFAEVTIERCKFIRNNASGISLGNFNALDVWVWNCLFTDCWLGVTNGFGAGNFRVYHSIFKNSKSSDIWIGNTGGFSIRDNYSINSKEFVGAGFTANPATMVIQGNTVVDPTSNFVIAISNQGPITLIDNIFKLKESAKGPCIGQWPSPNGNLVAIGNKYTVTNPYTLKPNVESRDEIVARSSLKNLSLPRITATPPNLNREIFEVPIGAATSQIQILIDKASEKGKRSVVHFPFGFYNIISTLNISKGSDVQLIGDSYGDRSASILRWAGRGAGPVINIAGPTKATIKNLTVSGSTGADAIVVTNIDQPGSRVYTNQLHVGSTKNNVSVESLDYTKLLMYNCGLSGAQQKALTITGGPLAKAGESKGGKTIIYSGAQSDNRATYQVTNGGNLLARDTWYESGSVGSYLKLSNSGTVTFDGCITATPASSTVPQFSVNNFNGNLTFIGNSIAQKVVVTGNGSKTNILSMGNGTGNKQYLSDSTSPAATIKSVSNRVLDPHQTMSSGGSYPAKDIGKVDEPYLEKMLKQTRNVHYEELTSLPADITDLRLWRVTITGALNGLRLIK